MFFVSDPPHLIKTVRNCWASKKRDLWVMTWVINILNLRNHSQCNGKMINWQHLVDLYKSGKGADRVAPGLSLLPKIKYEHVFLLENEG